jgi:hypothetical protein
MDCDTASGLMPWLINRTLASTEADDVQRHLEGCAACRNDLEQARRAAAVFSAHASSEAIVDLAWERDPGDGGLARRHVETCQACAEDLALARESRRAEQSSGARAAQPWRRARWLTLPATRAAGLLMGLTLPRPRPAATPTGAPLEAEIARLRGSVATLQAQVDALRAPELNLPVFELLPVALTRGSPAPGGNEIVVAEGARQVALVLVADADAAPNAPAAVEIRHTGKALWQADGLRPNPLGAYTLGVPASLLAEGEYAVVLRPRGAPPVEYRVRVRARDDAR